MIRRIIAVFLGLVLITCGLFIIDSIIDISMSAEGATLYVGGLGPGNYTTIRDAYDAASSGDDIYVYSGVYRERISIYKYINLTGEDKSSTIIDGFGGGTALSLSWGRSTIRGFTFTNASCGISIEASDVVITDNIILNNSFCGINVEDSLITIDNNTISNNSNIGIWLDHASDVALIKNEFVDNGILMEGDELSHFNTHVIGTENTINGDPIYYYKDTSNIHLDNVPVGQVIIANSSNVHLGNLSIQGMPSSMVVAYSSNIRIAHNNISNNDYGLYSYYSSSLDIHDNKITSNIEYGMRLQGTSDINITGNIVISNNGEGIHLIGSSNSTIRYNEISHNEDTGILLGGSDGNIISYNNVTDNGYNSDALLGGEGGIFLSLSSFNVVSNNNVTFNLDFGISLRHPLMWPPVEPAHNNTITNNYISSNNGFWSTWRTGISCIQALNVTISGNTILNHSYGISLRYASRYNINNNTVFINSKSGISISVSDNISVSNNTAFNCEINGIFIEESEDLIFTNNSANGNLGGFRTDFSSNLTLTNNFMTNNTYNFYILGDVDEHFIHTINTSNIVDGKPIYYLVNVSDFTVPEDAGFVGGVFCKNITVKNNVLRNNSHGVLFWKTQNSTVNNVTSYLNYNGLYFYHSVNNSIINCSSYTSAWYGLGFLDSHNNSIEDSHFFNNGFDGIYFDISTNNTIFGGNVSANKDEGIEFRYSSFNDIIGVDVSSNQWRGIYIYYSSYLGIFHNDLWDEWKAIEGWGLYNNISYNNMHDNSFDCIRLSGKNHTISYNSFSNNMMGITMSNSGNYRIINNEFINNNAGVSVRDSYDHLITNNNFSGNLNGIYIRDSNGNHVLNNTISDNTVGIYISDDSNNNLIDGNDILSNSDSGIFIYWYSHNNTISNNNISWNFDYGIYLNRSIDHLIYNNSFIGNGNQSYDDSANGNRWNESYPTGGNYWSDYVGPDDFRGPAQNITGSDGFGDSPYIIDGDSQDNYPLVLENDTKGPSIELISPLNNSVIKPGTILHFRIYDLNLESVTVSIDGNPGQSLWFPFELSTSSWLDGDHSVQVLAVDADGNSASKSYNFTIDSIKPHILPIDPVNNSVIAEGAIIDFSITDIHLKNVEISIDNDVFISFSEPFEVATNGWIEGEHIIKINAEDEAGNVNSEWFVFVLDLYTPEIILNSPANNSLISGGTVIDFSIIEGNILVVNYSIDDEADIPLSDPYDISTSWWPEGERVVRINVMDKAGNFISKVFVFEIDSSIPEIVLNNPEDSSVIPSGTSIDFSITDNNPFQAEFSINGDTFTSFSEPYDISTVGWMDGEYTLEIKAIDGAGNQANSLFYFTIDSLEPSIILNSPQNGTILNGPTILDFSIQDLHLWDASYTINEGTTIHFSDPFEISTSGWIDGAYMIEIIAFDTAGNSNSLHCFFELDSTRPYVISNDPVNDSVDVGLDKVVTIIFSEPMNQVEFENHLALSPHMDFSHLWSQDGTELFIQFDHELTEDTTYNLVLSSSIADIAGNSMASDYVLIFRTRLDTDGDGLSDTIDPDDDNDGHPDGVDEFPFNASEWLDTDSDGIGNNADMDDDNDGHLDDQDAYPLDPGRWKVEDAIPVNMFLSFIIIVLVLIVLILVLLRIKDKSEDEDENEEEPPRRTLPLSPISEEITWEEEINDDIIDVLPPLPPPPPPEA
jgi:parallel beta-helix repeat protein